MFELSISKSVAEKIEHEARSGKTYVQILGSGVVPMDSRSVFEGFHVFWPATGESGHEAIAKRAGVSFEDYKKFVSSERTFGAYLMTKARRHVPMASSRSAGTPSRA